MGEERHQSRATVIAAVIAAVGAVVAATAGHWVGREQGEDRIAAMQKQLRASADEMAELRAALTTQNRTIADLKARLQQPPEPGPGPVDGGHTADAKVDKDFRFELLGCNRSSSTIRCDFRVTNLSGDRELSINNDKSRIITTEGDEYYVDLMTIGAATERYVARTTMPGGVPVKAALTFNSIRPNTTTVRLLEFGAYTWERGGSRQDVLVGFGPAIAVK